MYTIAFLIVIPNSLNIVRIANICICYLNEDLISVLLFRLKNKKKSVVFLLEYKNNSNERKTISNSIL